MTIFIPMILLIMGILFFLLWLGIRILLFRQRKLCTRKVSGHIESLIRDRKVKNHIFYWKPIYVYEVDDEEYSYSSPFPGPDFAFPLDIEKPIYVDPENPEVCMVPEEQEQLLQETQIFFSLFLLLGLCSLIIFLMFLQ